MRLQQNGVEAQAGNTNCMVPNAYSSFAFRQQQTKCIDVALAPHVTFDWPWFRFHWMIDSVSPMEQVAFRTEGFCEGPCTNCVQRLRHMRSVVVFGSMANDFTYLSLLHRIDLFHRTLRNVLVGLISMLQRTDAEFK